MTFSKAFIYTTLLLTSNFTLAAQLFNPMAEYQIQKQAVQASQHTTEKTHKAQGSFPYVIPDNDPVGIDIPIDMTGVITGDLTNLELVIDIDHTFIGDLSATLISPEGLSTLVLFSRINSGANLAGEYVFSDDAINDLWVDSQNTSQVPEAEYRTSTAGFFNNGHGGCTTRMRGAFSGLTPDQSNGIWTLKVSDNEAQDTGQINDAYFIWSENSDQIFSSAFEIITSAPYVPLLASDVTGACQKAQYDFTGSGFSDYVVSWGNTSNDISVQIIGNEGDSTTVDEYIYPELPIPTTEMTSGGDFDGDGIKDFVFKTPLNDEAFQYLIRRSSRPDDLPLSIGIANPPAGATIDLQIGDYDADGLDDFAFFVTDEVNSNLAYLSIFQSSTFEPEFIQTVSGITADFRPGGGFDHNGDQIADLALFIDDGGVEGNQIAQVYNGLDGTLLFDSETARFIERAGMVPGTFLAENLAGVTIAFGTDRNEISWVIHDDTQDPNTLITIGGELFGESPTDVPVTGDYDGDGIDDLGLWRPDTDGLGNRFIIRPSGSADPDNNLIEVSPENAAISDRPLATIRIR